VAVRATPGATCTIAAGALASGAQPGELSARATDAAGRAAWSWTVGAVSPGEYIVSVSCGGATQAVTISVRA